eukprot:1160808-Pelagomonas_calceolata.AAC.1
MKRIVTEHRPSVEENGSSNTQPLTVEEIQHKGCQKGHFLASLQAAASKQSSQEARHQGSAAQRQAWL